MSSYDTERILQHKVRELQDQISDLQYAQHVKRAYLPSIDDRIEDVLAKHIPSVSQELLLDLVSLFERYDSEDKS